MNRKLIQLSRNINDSGDVPDITRKIMITKSYNGKGERDNFYLLEKLVIQEKYKYPIFTEQRNELMVTC